MDHHKGFHIRCRVEGFEDIYYYGRRPTNVYIPRFRNVKEKTPAFSAVIILVAVHQGHRQQSDMSIGAAFKEAMTEPGPWQMSLYAFGECLPYADNRITLNMKKKINGAGRC